MPSNHRMNSPPPWKSTTPPRPMRNPMLGRLENLPDGSLLPFDDDGQRPDCPKCGSRRTRVEKWPTTVGMTWFGAGRASCDGCGLSFIFIIDDE